MKTLLLRSLPILSLLPALAACGVGSSVVDEECAGGVCLAAVADADAQAATVAPADEECVPAEEETFANDPSGLRIGRVSLGDDGAALEVALVNQSELGVYSYPGTLLRVVEGDALVLTDMFGEQGPAEAEAVWQLYGIEACGENSHTYRVQWSEDSTVRLEAVAFDSLGDTVIHVVPFTLTRPGAPL